MGDTSCPPDTVSARLILDSADPPSRSPGSTPASFFLTAPDTARGVLILPMVLLLLCRTITTCSDTSCPPDTVSARLIPDSADPPSRSPGSTLASFFLTAPDTARGVLTPLYSLFPLDSLPGLPLVDTDTDPPATAVMDTPLARGVLILPMVLPLLCRTITTSSDTSCPLDTVSARLILDSVDPSSKYPDCIHDTDMEAMVTSTRRCSQC